VVLRVAVQRESCQVVIRAPGQAKKVEVVVRLLPLSFLLMGTHWNIHTTRMVTVTFWQNQTHMHHFDK
jgi:hypothetical protein